MNFQDVVHSVQAGETEVATLLRFFSNSQENRLVPSPLGDGPAAHAAIKKSRACGNKKEPRRRQRKRARAGGNKKEREGLAVPDTKESPHLIRPPRSGALRPGRPPDQVWGKLFSPRGEGIPADETNGREQNAVRQKQSCTRSKPAS